MTLADRLRWARTSSGLKARQLDRAAGLGEGHVAMIESGKRTDVGAKTASAIAHALGVSLDWLVDGEGKPPSERALRAHGESLREAS